jgi:hypothetical protein
MIFRPAMFVFGLLAGLVLTDTPSAMAAGLAGSAGRWRQQLETASRDRFRALVARDLGYLAKHYTADFQLVGSDGRMGGVALLRGLIAHGARDLNFAPFDYQVFVSADGSQGVVYHKSHDTEDGRNSDSEYTEVWVRSAGTGWMLRFEQYADDIGGTPARKS